MRDTENIKFKFLVYQVQELCKIGYIVGKTKFVLYVQKKTSILCLKFMWLFLLALLQSMHGS